MSQEIAKKLVSVLITSMLVTKDNEKTIFINAKELEQIICIQYPITFSSNVTQDGLALDLILALLDSNSKINTIYLTFAKN